MSTTPHQPDHDDQSQAREVLPSEQATVVRKGFFRRHKLLTGAGLVVALGIVVAASTSGGDSSPAVADGVPAQSSEVAHAEDADVADDTVADDTVTDDVDVADDAAADDNGTDADDTSGADDWYESRWGSFDAIHKSGRGQSVVRLPDGVTAGMVTAEHKGSSNFVIEALDDGNQSTGDLLVNEIGRYQGTTAFGLSSFGEARSLKITADGPWTITVAELADAPALPSSGTGDGVFRFDGDATTWRLTNKGESNFVVFQVSDALMPNLAVNEIGAFSGEVPALAGPSIVAITSDGAWTVRS